MQKPTKNIGKTSKTTKKSDSKKSDSKKIEKPKLKTSDKSEPKKYFTKTPKPKPKKTTKENPDDIRLNKYIANSGACSRRDADIYISSGNVKVNGQIITEMGYQVKPTDVVNFDGKIVTPEKKVYILLNKPKNFTTTIDEVTDKSVYDLVKAATNLPIQTIGRMDKNTTGLLLLTNDNDIIVKFNAPNQKSPKIYQVSLDKNLKYEDLEKISTGVTLDNHKLYVDEITYIEKEPKTEIGIKLRTANVKVVRAIFESFKYNVLKVDRVSFAGLTKKNLPRGNWRFFNQSRSD